MKKTTITVMCLLLVLSFAGCGEKNANGSGIPLKDGYFAITLDEFFAALDPVLSKDEPFEYAFVVEPEDPEDPNEVNTRVVNITDDISIFVSGHPSTNLVNYVGLAVLSQESENAFQTMTPYVEEVLALLDPGTSIDELTKLTEGLENPGGNSDVYIGSGGKLKYTYLVSEYMDGMSSNLLMEAN